MATEPKSEPTPRRTAARKANPERAPRPEFVVIEDNLHYSPDGVRDIVVSIDPEWRLVEPILLSANDDAGQGEVFSSILEVLYGDKAGEIVRGLKTSQFFKLAYRWMDEFTKNMGIEQPGE